MKNSKKIANINTIILENKLEADVSVRPKHKENTQNGVTLLALIVTIIVLLILSLVSVQLVTKSGIIERVKQGVIQHKLQEIHENVKLDYISLKIGRKLNVINMSNEIKDLQKKKYKKYIENVSYTSTKVFYKMTDKLDGKEYMIDIKTGEIGTYVDKLERIEGDSSLWIVQGSTIIGYKGTDDLLQNVVVPNIVKRDDGTEVKITNVSLSNINFEGTLTFASKVTINSGTTCSTVKNIIIGDNVTIDGAYGTFYNCAELTTVTMGRSIKIIDMWGGRTLFNNCPKLASVKVESLSEIVTNALKGAGPALKGDIVINEGVTTIGSSAFEGCSNITSVSIPSTVTEIGLTAFKNCTNLKKAIIPESVKVIRYGAFTDCINMKQEVTIKSGVELGKTEKGYFESAFAGSGITKLIVEDEVKIPLREGTNCPNLKEIIIGDNVTIDGAYGTFNNCPELTTVKMGKNIKITDMWSNMTLFKNCPKLENVTVESLSEIAASAFVGTGPALKGDIIIEEGVTTIGTSAFEGCTNITSVSIPNTVTNIGDRAFYNCTGLGKINVNMTKTEWEAVTKGSNWNTKVTAEIVFLK